MAEPRKCIKITQHSVSKLSKDSAKAIASTLAPTLFENKAGKSRSNYPIGYMIK